MRRAAFLGLLLAGCWSRARAPAPAPTGEDIVSTVPDVPFEQLDHDQRIAFMKQKVVPTMAPLFQRHDAARFAKFSCQTCHGAAALEGEFHMPNDALPRLHLGNLAKHDPEDVEFMTTVVKPMMAKLLKQPEHSRENPDGFGCLACHLAAPASP